MIGAVLRGYWLTLRHFFRRPVTVRYPEIRREPHPRFRGFPALRRHPEDGRERCVACGLCVAICPARCIEMTTEPGPDGRKRAVTYLLDAGRCLYCGLCAEVCPVEAVVLTRGYELVVTDRREVRLDKDALLRNGKGL